MFPLIALLLLQVPAPPDWLPGAWEGRKDGVRIEERWLPGESGLLGVFRMEREGKAVFLEAMVIERDGQDTVLRIRHFGPGLKAAWEDKDKPVVFLLARADAKEARFEGTGPRTGEILTYRRVPPDGLEVVLEKKAADGTPRKSAFAFRRAN